MLSLYIKQSSYNYYIRMYTHNYMYVRHIEEKVSFTLQCSGWSCLSSRNTCQCRSRCKCHWWSELTIFLIYMFYSLYIILKYYVKKLLYLFIILLNENHNTLVIGYVIAYFCTTFCVLLTCYYILLETLSNILSIILSNTIQYSYIGYVTRNTIQQP